MILDINKIATVVKNLMADDELVETVYLYGSYVKGEASEKSDVDLVVVLKDEATHLKFDLELYLDKLNTKLDRQVQLSILSKEKTGSLFKHEVLSTGQVLIDNQPRARVNKEIQDSVEYADYQIWIKDDQLDRLKKSVQVN